MNQNELHKHICIDILIVAFTIICFLFSLYMIIFYKIDVKAATITADVTSSLSIPTSYTSCTQTNGHYWGDNGSSNACKVWNVRTSYNGVLYSLEMVLKNAWSVNTVAFVNINAMSTDFRNNNLYCTISNSSGTSLPCNLTFNSKSQIQVSFIPNQVGNYTLGIYSNTFDAITGINTFGIKSVIIKQATGDNSDIIDNANENTNSIIDSMNDNMGEIELSLQDNLHAIQNAALAGNNDNRLSASQSCKNLYYTPIEKSYRICTSSSTCTTLDDNAYSMSDVVAISLITNTGNDSKIYVYNPASSTAGYYFIFYDSNKNVISYERTSTRTLTIPNGAVFFRFSSTVDNTLIYRGKMGCIDSGDIINSYLTDDTDPSINNQGVSDALDGVEVSDPLNYLLTLPIHLLQKINTVLSANSCQRVSFGSLYNTDLYLPCINFSQILGSSVWNTIDLIVGVALLVVILKHFYNTISNITTLGKEKEVRDKLDLPTPMQFLASILGGGKD